VNPNQFGILLKKSLALLHKGTATLQIRIVLVRRPERLPIRRGVFFPVLGDYQVPAQKNGAI
jgi:hypothetical protein